MLKNEYLVTKIGFDTAENEPSEIVKYGCWTTTDRAPCTGVTVTAVEVSSRAWRSHYKVRVESVVSNNQKVVGILSVGGAMTMAKL